MPSAAPPGAPPRIAREHGQLAPELVELLQRRPLRRDCIAGECPVQRRVGVAVRRSATAAGSPLQAAIRHAAALGSASRLRGWAHDVLEAVDSSPRSDNDALGADEPDPERRVAAAALEFLREAGRVLRPGGMLVANALAAHRHADRAAEGGHVQPGFTPRALDRLIRHDWPGNVRELKNVIESAAVIAGSGGYIEPAQLPTKITGSSNRFSGYNRSPTAGNRSTHAGEQ